MLLQSVSKNSLLLGLFALVIATGLALTHSGTRDRIEQAERAARQSALFEIVPPEQHDNDLLLDVLPVPEHAWPQLGLKQPADIYIARRQGEVIAVIIPAVAPDGYSGDISLITGVNRDLGIAGVRVVNHNETPGLGDKLELKKGPWILSFNGHSLGSLAPEYWAVSKDGGVFDQFTGATITPRAVVNQVKRVLEFAESHRDLLFAPVVSPPDLTHE